MIDEFEMSNMERKNVFLREYFDPFVALFGSSSNDNNNNNSNTSTTNDVMVPPISNIKPYKTFDAINLDQLLLKNKQKQKQQIKKEEKMKESVAATTITMDRDAVDHNQVVASNSSSLSAATSSSGLLEQQNQSTNYRDDTNKMSVKSNIPDVKDLPTLAHKDTYRGFLEHKYGQSSSSSSFTLLYQAVMEKKRVRVMVRTRHGQGKLEGILSGFDKFFNMILLDVKENYKELEIRFKKQKTLDKERGIIIPTSKKKNSRNRKRRVRCLVEKERQFPLLFVKGCQVISVMGSSKE